MSSLPPLHRRTVTAAFARALEEVPDKVAHSGAEGSWTFAEAYDRSRRLGGGLVALEPGVAAPVGLMLDNSIDFVHTWLGLALAGGVQVPINTGYRGSFLSHILDDADCEVIVVESGYVERLQAVVSELPKLKVVVVRGETDIVLPGVQMVPFGSLLESQPVTPVDVAPGDLIAYMYTSGTTGRSKGVEVTHAHAYTYASREDQSRPTPDDVTIVTLPLFHLAGQWYGVYQSLITRMTCHVKPAFSVSGFWPAVREHGVTFTVMLGAMAELLQQAPVRDDDADNPLEVATMAPLASNPETFSTRFGVRLEPVYGMSEIGGVMGGYGSELVPGEAGVARAEYELRLVDPEGHDVEDGTVGELWVRPAHPELVMARYHGLPEKTAETIVDGWVHTGDAFRRVDGHYFFADRMKDALRRRGENISSFEVERIINEHPGVFESAVVGVPSSLGEDEIKAVVVPREGVEIDPVELTGFLVERMPYFMVPRYLAFAPALPKTPTLKVQKHVVRDAGTEDCWDREAAGIVLRRGN
jgi:crotonobetaine/carnitine-CoA ligase